MFLEAEGSDGDGKGGGISPEFAKKVTAKLEDEKIKYETILKIQDFSYNIGINIV